MATHRWLQSEIVWLIKWYFTMNKVKYRKLTVITWQFPDKTQPLLQIISNVFCFALNCSTLITAHNRRLIKNQFGMASICGLMQHPYLAAFAEIELYDMIPFYCYKMMLVFVRFLVMSPMECGFVLVTLLLRCKWIRVDVGILPWISYNFESLESQASQGHH